MIGETFQYVKQVGYVLTVRESIKTGNIFVKERKGEWFCPRACCLCLRIIKHKLIWIQKVGKGLWKRTFEKRTLYIFRIKARLNLTRWMKVLLIVSWYKTLLVSEW